METALVQGEIQNIHEALVFLIKNCACIFFRSAVAGQVIIIPWFNGTKVVFISMAIFSFLGCVPSFLKMWHTQIFLQCYDCLFGYHVKSVASMFGFPKVWVKFGCAYQKSASFNHKIGPIQEKVSKIFLSARFSSNNCFSGFSGNHTNAWTEHNNPYAY